MKTLRALGLDWSGGAAARTKVWAALVEGDALVQLWRPFAGLDLRARPRALAGHAGLPAGAPGPGAPRDLGPRDLGPRDLVPRDLVPRVARDHDRTGPRELTPHDRPAPDPRDRPALDPHDRPAPDPHDRPAPDPHDRPAPDPHDRPAPDPHAPPATAPRAIADAFAPWLAAQRFDVAGFDFCFALEAGQAARLGLPRDPAAAGAALAARFGDDAQAFRDAAGPERRRATDALRGAPFAPTNLRMFRQTFWGLRALSGVPDPIAPWRDGPRRLHEVLPRRRVSQLCGPCRYKDGGTRAERLRLVRALGLRIDAAARAALLDDGEGDAIDAVLAALEARGARLAGEAAPASAIRSGEGWIYSG